jgi:L-glutamine-phosphate cytidylyltransferase
VIGVLIAAGPGSRMGPFAEGKPKCLLPVGGRTLIDWTLDNFRQSGCDELIAVVGHRAETIERPGLTKVMNANYRNNNILHSFMQAESRMIGAVVASYSDIYVEPDVYRTLMATPGDIVLAVDVDWRPYYDGRSKHPLAEAENIYLDAKSHVRQAGKHLDDNPPSGERCGEFLGVWRMSEKGTAVFRDHFDRLKRDLSPTQPFQHAREWQKAYITDMVQELVDWGVPVNCALVERGWAELDTEEDYQRLPHIAARQRLSMLVEVQVK